MKFLRKIYPLWLREKIYFTLCDGRNQLPKNTTAFPLEFAPVKLHALLLTDYAHRQIAWLGFYELDLSRKIASLAKQGGLMLDVGANIGYFSCIWAATNSSNEVWAFEPSPRNISKLRQNTLALDNPQIVRILDCALGKAAGAHNFDIGPEDQSGWGGLANVASPTSIQVKVCRLDDLVPPERIISVLKIDTEGADTWVLFGAERILREKRIKHIFFEANLERMQQLGIQADEAQRYLSELGYEVCPLGSQEFHATPR